MAAIIEVICRGILISCTFLFGCLSIAFCVASTAVGLGILLLIIYYGIYFPVCLIIHKDPTKIVKKIRVAIRTRFSGDDM